jgi:hypothetical protein
MKAEPRPTNDMKTPETSTDKPETHNRVGSMNPACFRQYGRSLLMLPPVFATCLLRPSALKIPNAWRPQNLWWSANL